MPITMSQIVGNAPKDRKKNSKEIVLTGFKVGSNKSKPSISCTAHSQHDKLNYTTSVTAINGKPKFSAPGTPVKVECTCPDHKFTWEYALSKVGGSDIKYSNGDPPNERNPALVPSACKHVLALLRAIKDKNL